ncbi:MAG: hypothetical protein FJZ01_28310, partial [Candidatus Sericytochromatia bacterium]|nr:hypothetical protein [Candidatus Tanganyikabacteria bacterium]
PQHPAQAAASPDAGTKLSKLDVPALQRLYEEVLGRESRSTSRNYLVWKIREARKGRVPVGPRASRRQEGEKVMVLPLRMEASLVARLDEAWRRLGLGNRTELFRTALSTYFESVGELDIAGLMRLN